MTGVVGLRTEPVESTKYFGYEQSEIGGKTEGKTEEWMKRNEEEKRDKRRKKRKRKEREKKESTAIGSDTLSCRAAVRKVETAQTIDPGASVRRKRRKRKICGL